MTLQIFKQLKILKEDIMNYIVINLNMDEIPKILVTKSNTKRPLI